MNVVAVTDDLGLVVRPDLLAAAEPVHRQLRPQLPADYAARLGQIFGSGGRMAVAQENGRVVGVCVYRILEKTYSGREIYCDDLVTDEAKALTTRRILKDGNGSGARPVGRRGDRRVTMTPYERDRVREADPDPAVPGELNGSTNTLKREGKLILDDSDAYGVEMALQLVDKAGSGEVILVSMAPNGEVSGLRQALAMGAARAVLVSEIGRAHV